MGKSVRMFNLLPGEREKRVSGALFTPQLLCTLLALIFFLVLDILVFLVRCFGWQSSICSLFLL